MEQKGIELDFNDLSIARYGDQFDRCELKTGRLKHCRGVEKVTVLCIGRSYSLEFDDLFIDLNEDEAKQIAGILEKPIVYSDE